MRSYRYLLLFYLFRRLSDGGSFNRLGRCLRCPLGIHKQQYDPTDQREGSDDWGNKMSFCGLNVYSKEIDRLPRSREGEARVSKHYYA